MFELCTSLVSIEINSVYTIEARAFARCTSLRCIYYEGESEPDINDEAFDVENNITVIVKETYENKKFGNLPIATYTEECGNINGKTSGNDDEKNSNTGEIVGGIVGSIGLVLLVGVLSCCHDHLCKCFRCCVECTCCDVGSSTSERGKMTPFEIEMFPLEKKIKSVLPPGIKAEQIPYQNPFGIGYETSIYQK
ncbi:hypothetical protein GPJ56_011055 [Histomonas meleagridis]|uniref:uncharacterized protein n=1 Tax=Histomonas meleagridis TaxID=135588 RepID=UPI00355A5A6A|nr:hypothetical protein GPJ56_011055 [Histomonas meleagridis]KAH0800832.1 hypothetical protein GO595_006585 [Histomonas meleagridis]